MPYGKDIIFSVDHSAETISMVIPFKHHHIQIVNGIITLIIDYI